MNGVAVDVADEERVRGRVVVVGSACWALMSCQRTEEIRVLN